MSVPTGLAQLAAFVLFVTPGVAFKLAYARWRPSPDRSAFQEFAAVIVVSVAATGVVALVALALVSDGWFAALRSTALRPDLATPAELLNLGTAAGAAMLAAIALAVFAAFLLTLTTEGRFFNEPVWFLLFGRAEGTSQYVVARLNNGNRYLGKLIAYTSTQVPQSDRDIVLGPPLFVQWAGMEEPAPLGDVERVSLSGGEIESLSVTYYPKGSLRD